MDQVQHLCLPNIHISIFNCTSETQGGCRRKNSKFSCHIAMQPNQELINELLVQCNKLSSLNIIVEEYYTEDTRLTIYTQGLTMN